MQRLLVFLREIGFAEQPQREAALLTRKLGMLNDKRVELSGKIFTRYEIAEKMVKRKILHENSFRIDWLKRVDVGKKGGQQLVVGKLLDHFSLGKEHADAVAARDADVCLARLAGTVDHAAHDRDGDGLFAVSECGFHAGGKGNEIDAARSTV